jgi:hypothetical protein
VGWRRVYCMPPTASFSPAGAWKGPQKALEEPTPASSMRTIGTLGAPLGGPTCSVGGSVLSGALAPWAMTRGRVGFGSELEEAGTAVPSLVARYLCPSSPVLDDNSLPSQYLTMYLLPSRQTAKAFLKLSICWAVACCACWPCWVACWVACSFAFLPLARPTTTPAAAP